MKRKFTTTSCQRQFLDWSSRPASAWQIRRCLRGATQSQNEAFNDMIWNMWRKQELAGAEVVELSAHLAAARFIKHGAVTFLAVLRRMGCTIQRALFNPMCSSKMPKESGRLKSRLLRSRSRGEKLWEREGKALRRKKWKQRAKPINQVPFWPQFLWVTCVFEA